MVSLWSQDGIVEGSNHILLFQFSLAISRVLAHWDFDPVWTGAVTVAIILPGANSRSNEGRFLWVFRIVLTRLGCLGV
jgi:hypothetical protein